LERAGSLIIFRDVPADVCDNCGAYFLSEDISKELFEKANEAVKNGAQVEILRLSA
jgi:hypothetical protein